MSHYRSECAVCGNWDYLDDDAVCPDPDCQAVQADREAAR